MGCLAQDKPAATARDASESAPAEVDQALWDRATKFYQAHVDAKYRQAEEYVAEDTKDYYYASQKPHYLSFEIKKISYSDHFTKAKVTTICRISQASNFGIMTFNVPQTSNWRLEGGLWYWYTDPNAIATPFGTMKHSQPGAAQSGEPAPTMKPLVSNVGELWKQVTADKSEVRFGNRPGSSEVVIKNGLPGAISLKLLEPAPAVPGLEVKLERNQVPSHQTVRIFFKYKPEAAAPKKTVVSIEVQPTNQTIPIQVVCER
jgi:hypothetical protein